MYSKRKNARCLKTLTPFERVMGHIMPTRSDAQVYYSDDIDCEILDEYIEKKKAEGIELTYLDIFTAATVRLYAKRPALNRFIMGGRTFANDKIYVSMAVKKLLRDNCDETTIKVPFTGHENIFEVRERMRELIYAQKGMERANGTDKTARLMRIMPNWVLRFAFWWIRVLDKRSMLPAKLVEVSPFHTSVFITYLKSLGIPGIYHHCYDLGTVGQFIAVGKERRIPVIDKKTGQVRPGKVITIMVVADERICDGLYYARSMRLFRRVLENPEVLEERLEVVEEDIA